MRAFIGVHIYFSACLMVYLFIFRFSVCFRCLRMSFVVMFDVSAEGERWTITSFSHPRFLLRPRSCFRPCHQVTHWRSWFRSFLGIEALPSSSLGRGRPCSGVPRRGGVCCCCRAPGRWGCSWRLGVPRRVVVPSQRVRLVLHLRCRGHLMAQGVAFVYSA